MHQHLIQNAYWQPLDASCQISYETLRDIYFLRIQIGQRRNEIHLLQAIRQNKEETTKQYTLILNGNVLEAIFHLGVMEQI